jgi:hypothetical protein
LIKIILIKIQGSYKKFLVWEIIIICIFYYDCVIIIIIICSAGAWTQGLHLEPLHQPFFVMGFFEIGSLKLFAPAGFKLRSSWSLSPV